VGNRKEYLSWLILDTARKSGFATNWHLNEEFLDWAIEFSQSKEIGDIRVVQRAYSRFCKNLAKEGLLEDGVRVGLGRGSMSEFGARTQTVWNISDKGKNAKIIKRVFCDCCDSSFKDYVLTDRNSKANPVYLCTMCSENIINDIKNNREARNTADELKAIEKSQFLFDAENILVDCGNQ
jgi:hypothetical protein